MSKSHSIWMRARWRYSDTMRFKVVPTKMGWKIKIIEEMARLDCLLWYMWYSPDINEKYSIVSVLLLICRYSLMKFKGKKLDLMENIEENKIRNLSILTSLCYIILKGSHNQQTNESHTEIIYFRVITKYLKALHNVKWINYQIFSKLIYIFPNNSFNRNSQQNR